MRTFAFQLVVDIGDFRRRNATVALRSWINFQRNFRTGTTLWLFVLLLGVGCARKPQYPGVDVYEREVMATLENLESALSAAEKSGNVVPLIGPAEKANAALTQINYAMMNELDAMSAEEFAALRANISSRMASRIAAIRTGLSRVHPNPVYTVEMSASPIQYIETCVLSFSLSTNQLDSATPRANQWIQGGTFIE